MIAAMVAGGTGNQMFQYAAGRALALRHGTDLMLDLSPYRGRHFLVSRPYQLDHLSIELHKPSPLTKLSFLLARRPSPLLQRASGWRPFREKEAGYDRAFETLPDRSYLVGYWQSWRFFQIFSTQIRQELQPRQPLSAASRRVLELAAKRPSVAVHVRRGDYLIRDKEGHGFFLLGIEHYSRAIRYVQERVSELQVLVFSDDLAWCKQSFSGLGADLNFVGGNAGADGWQDIHLIAACDHAIIANSSFSWWGAWLGDEPGRRQGRIVIAPQQWHSRESDTDRCPPHWLTM